MGLLLQAEQDLLWGVREEDAAHPDPPVVAWWLEDEDSGSWQLLRPWTPSLTAFVLSHAVTYLYPAGGGFSLRVDSADEAARLLAPYAVSRLVLGDMTLVEGPDLVADYGSAYDLDDGYTVLTFRLGASFVRNVPEGLRPLVDRASMTFGRMARRR